MTKVVIFGDSLVRPRPDIDEQHKTEYEDTYAWKVREYLSEAVVDVCYVESLDSESALAWNQRMVAFRRPDIVIYHLGINDCVQRIFRKNSRSLLLKPWFQKLTANLGLRLISRHRALLLRTVVRNKRHVPLPAFRNNMLQMVEDVRRLSPNVRFICVGIAQKPAWLEARSPGDNGVIASYNAALSEMFGEYFLDIGRIGSPENVLIDDGIHLSARGHGILAGLIAEMLCRLREEDM